MQEAKYVMLSKSTLKIKVQTRVKELNLALQVVSMKMTKILVDSSIDKISIIKEMKVTNCNDIGFKNNDSNIRTCSTPLLS